MFTIVSPQRFSDPKVESDSHLQIFLHVYDVALEHVVRLRDAASVERHVGDGVDAAENELHDVVLQQRRVH